MARPILRLATRFTRRTRMTAWAIAFACMVLVGTLSLADGLGNGLGSVADRIDAGLFVYIRGRELLASEIDANALAPIRSDFVALRAHAGQLEINRITVPVVAVALVEYTGGIGTIRFPSGNRNLSLDTGLRDRVERLSGTPLAASGNLTLFGLPPLDLAIVGPPAARSALFADDWAYVRADLLTAMDPVRGGSVQAIIANAPLDGATIQRLGLSRLDTLGAVGFVRAATAEAQASFRLLALVIGIVIALLVYAAMSLEVHQRAREIATLRSLGASPSTVAGVYEAQAILLAVAGAIVGSALGIVVANAVVSFAPLVGLPNLVVLSPPIDAIGLALLVTILAAVLAGFVPSRRAAVLVRARGAIRS
jgi:predicted lysophospholipase L1 biosynthesis ABC-type transport system permease subunit